MIWASNYFSGSGNIFGFEPELVGPFTTLDWGEEDQTANHVIVCPQNLAPDGTTNA